VQDYLPSIISSLVTIQKGYGMKTRVSTFMMVLAGLICLSLTSFSLAWEYPMIKGYGPVQPFPNAAVQPDPSIKYKVLFDVTAKSARIEHANPGLSHIARFINAMASAGVTPRQMQLVAIIHGGATPFALRGEIYKEMFQMDNPNPQLIKELKSAGVQLYVCGQALAEEKFKPEWVNPDISIAFSALVLVPTYQFKGYAYQPLF
jgi:intracellular sulfur oxidation DsrE/DsrF family protein